MNFEARQSSLGTRSWKGWCRMEWMKKLAETGAISGPYKTRQLPRIARLLREPGPLPLWVRYRTRRELDAIERMEEPPRPVRRSVLFGLFAGVE